MDFKDQGKQARPGDWKDRAQPRDSMPDVRCAPFADNGRETVAPHGIGGILIVDEMPRIRRHLRDILEKEGYYIAGEASDGDEAVPLAVALQPDLVVMDMVMKRMDGIVAAGHIRRLCPEARVVMVTREARPAVVLNSMKAGAVNFITKPFQDQQVISVVRNALKC